MSPLPIGTYPFRDSKRMATQTFSECLHCLSALTPFGTNTHQLINTINWVSIAYRHLPLSGLVLENGRLNVSEGLHCLSALTPFGTGVDEYRRLMDGRSPLPIGTYPFRDAPTMRAQVDLLQSPLPIGTYPFRDPLSLNFLILHGVRSPLPIGTYPFRDFVMNLTLLKSRLSPLPIGTYPFRDGNSPCHGQKS